MKQIIASSKRNVTDLPLFLPPTEILKTLALMPILLLFGLVFRPSLKIFDTQLTPLLAAKDVAE